MAASPENSVLGALDPSVRRIGEPQASVDPSLSRTRLVSLSIAALVTPALLMAEWTEARSPNVPLVIAAAAVSFILVIARMCSQVDALEGSRAQLAYDATHDHLTGLANRSLFARHLDGGIGLETSGALLFIDLEKFKSVNDQLGHRARNRRPCDVCRQSYRRQQLRRFSPQVVS